jgi:hypothetical protein
MSNQELQSVIGICGLFFSLTAFIILVQILPELI